MILELAINKQAKKYEDSDVVPKSVFDKLLQTLETTVKKVSSLEKIKVKYKLSNKSQSEMKQQFNVLQEKTEQLKIQEENMKSSRGTMETENFNLKNINKKLESYFLNMKNKNIQLSKDLKDITEDRDKWYELSQELEHNIQD